MDNNLSFIWMFFLSKGVIYSMFISFLFKNVWLIDFFKDVFFEKIVIDNENIYVIKGSFKSVLLLLWLLSVKNMLFVIRKVENI